jgi:hypothetical protein
VIAGVVIAGVVIAGVVAFPSWFEVRIHLCTTIALNPFWNVLSNGMHIDYINKIKSHEQ